MDSAKVVDRYMVFQINLHYSSRPKRSCWMGVGTRQGKLLR